MLPRIEDKHLLVHAPASSTPSDALAHHGTGFARNNGGLAWLGRAALTKELSLLILGLGPTWTLQQSNVSPTLAVKRAHADDLEVRR